MTGASRGTGAAIAVRADFASAPPVRSRFDAAEAAFGGVDVLVNNAGIVKLASIAGVEDVEFDPRIAVNLRRTSNGLREAAKRLRKGGRISNSSSSVIGPRLETHGSTPRPRPPSRR